MQYAVYSMHCPYGTRASAIGRVILSVVLVVTIVWLWDVLLASMLKVVGLTNEIYICWRWWCWFEAADLSLLLVPIVLWRCSSSLTPVPSMGMRTSTTTVGGAVRKLPWGLVLWSS